MKTFLACFLLTAFSFPQEAICHNDKKVDRTSCIKEKNIKAFMVNPDELKWENEISQGREGLEIAPLVRNSKCHGHYVSLMKIPAGYEAKPHVHPSLEQLTVVTGVLNFGVGDTFDKTKSKPLTPGSFLYCPGGTHHYFWTDTETIVLIHGIGPYQTTFINPSDKPKE